MIIFKAGDPQTYNPIMLLAKDIEIPHHVKSLRFTIAVGKNAKYKQECLVARDKYAVDLNEGKISFQAIKLKALLRGYPDSSPFDSVATEAHVMLEDKPIAYYRYSTAQTKAKDVAQNPKDLPIVPLAVKADKELQITSPKGISAPTVKGDEEEKEEKPQITPPNPITAPKVMVLQDLNTLNWGWQSAGSQLVKTKDGLYKLITDTTGSSQVKYTFDLPASVKTVKIPYTVDVEGCTAFGLLNTDRSKFIIQKSFKSGNYNDTLEIQPKGETQLTLVISNNLKSLKKSSTVILKNLQILLEE